MSSALRFRHSDYAARGRKPEVERQPDPAVRCLVQSLKSVDRLTTLLAFWDSMLACVEFAAFYGRARAPRRGAMTASTQKTRDRR